MTQDNGLDAPPQISKESILTAIDTAISLLPRYSGADWTTNLDGCKLDVHFAAEYLGRLKRDIEAQATQDQPPLIYARMSAVMADIGAIDKDKTNKQQGFKYRGIDDIYNALHTCMAKHQVFTTSKALDVHREEKPTKSGGKIGFCIVKIRYTFHTVDGSSIATEIIGEGMDTADKATNKAFAIAHKYALLQAFMIPTEDPKDPDADSPDIEWITSEQSADLQILADEVGANIPLFLKHMKAQSMGRIQSCDYKRAVAALESKRKKS